MLLEQLVVSALHLLQEAKAMLRSEQLVPTCLCLPLDINQMARGCIKTRCSRGISVPPLASWPSLLLLHSLVRNFHVNNIECSVTYLASIRNSSAMQSPQALEWTVSPWYFCPFPPFPSLVYFQFLIVASLVLTVIEIASRTSNGQHQFLHSLPFSPSLCSGFV